MASDPCVSSFPIKASSRLLRVSLQIFNSMIQVIYWNKGKEYVEFYPISFSVASEIDLKYVIFNTRYGQKAYHKNQDIMNDSLEPKEKPEEEGIDPEKVEFKIEEKELEDISGGLALGCGEIGVTNFGCTNTGA